MSELLDEVKASFEKYEKDTDDGSGSIQMIDSSAELAPGFPEMREYYNMQLQALVRRGYHYYAGSTMPRVGEELLVLTGKYLQAPAVALVMGAFCDGLMVGHETDQTVKMAKHYNAPGHVFHVRQFRDASLIMTKGFAEDEELAQYFAQYLSNGMSHLAHATGFAHAELDSAKVWDLWMLVGMATTCTSFVAGYQLGCKWKERDVLDGIEIATEEAPDVVAGEAEDGL